MAASTNKKVLVARFDKAALEGFVQLPEGLTPEGLDLLSPDGNLSRVPLAEVRAVCFVRDFENGESWQKHKTYQSRPKSAGLWVRIRFRDGEVLEGVMPNNLLRNEPNGFSFVPPDPTFQNQRIFVPREAVTSLEVLGVIGSPLRRRPKPAPGEQDDQLEMFP
ncbi:MAG: hypothetical protein ABI811_13215 [Acidobacteriota bacterium]